MHVPTIIAIIIVESALMNPVQSNSTVGPKKKYTKHASMTNIEISSESNLPRNNLLVCLNILNVYAMAAIPIVSPTKGGKYVPLNLIHDLIHNDCY